MRFLVIGIGTGNPGHMTMQAIAALNRADIVLLPKKGEGKEDLAELRREICRLHLRNPSTRIVEFDLPLRDASLPYHEGVESWHADIARAYRDLTAENLQSAGTAALLVWGDPSLYDSTLRILARLKTDHGFSFSLETVPGITALQALTAAHAIPLNEVGGSVLVTTGRRLKEEGPGDAGTIAVMLDGDMAFRTLDPDSFFIWWGAYLGSNREILVSGRLAEVADRIAEERAAARRAHGWIMDTYLLRRIDR